VGGVWLAAGRSGRGQEGAAPAAEGPPAAQADPARPANRTAPPAGKPGTGAGGSAAGGKAITLAEAVTLAEQAGKGQAVWAERQGAGADASFTVDLLGGDGARVRVRLSAAGQVLGSGPTPAAGRPRERPWGERPRRQRDG
jgi:hypothetical protein